MKRRAGLRPSFVVTIAATALGCGANVTTEPPPPASCPEARPTHGAACPPGTYPVSLICRYDISGECYSTEARCDGPGAVWSVQQSSCNPPVPTCPPTRPAASDLCPYGWYIGPALRCRYDPCSDGYVAEAVCTGYGNGRRWTVTQASCSPPEPTCPAIAPLAFSTCALPPIPCAYGSCTYSCVDGSWSVSCSADGGVFPADT